MKGRIGSRRWPRAIPIGSGYSRYQGGSVYRFDGHQLTADPLVPASTHITANADGTLGVCHGRQAKAVDAAGVVLESPVRASARCTVRCVATTTA